MFARARHSSRYGSRLVPTHDPTMFARKTAVRAVSQRRLRATYMVSEYAPAAARPSLLCGPVRSGSRASGRQAATRPPRRTLIDALAGAIGNSIPSGIAGGVFQARMYPHFLTASGLLVISRHARALGISMSGRALMRLFRAGSDTRLGGVGSVPLCGDLLGER